MGLYQRELQPRLLRLACGGAATAELREEVCAGLAGDVVEIGYGSGLNQVHLPAAVASMTAVEPSAVAFRLSDRRRRDSSVPVRLGGPDAQRMPFGDAVFDAALSTWTLCGIDDPVAALREVRRVLKPGGVLHFVEHGLAPDVGVARWQRRANAVNRRVAGCFLDRHVPGLLAAAGLTVSSLAAAYEPGWPRSAHYFYRGRAVA